VACTATTDAALCPVDPLSGTMVTSEISCLRASAADVVVVVFAAACLARAGPFDEKTPPTMRPTTKATTSTKALVRAMTVLPIVCPRRIVCNLRAALPPIQESLRTGCHLVVGSAHCLR
jgi:hypothetical protein